MRLKEFRENCIAACSTHRRRKSVPDPWRRNREVPTSTGGGSKRRYHQVISRGRPESPPTSFTANWKAQLSNVVRSSTSRSLPNQRSNFEIAHYQQLEASGAHVACSQICVNISVDQPEVWLLHSERAEVDEDGTRGGQGGPHYNSQDV